MELRQLNYFVAVAEARNFTRAAGRLHVSQSTLSVAVRTLEHELGVRLLNRSTRHVELSVAGNTLLHEARRTLSAAENARRAVTGVADGSRGPLNVGIMQSLLLIDLAGLLTAYHREHPGVRLRPRTAAAGSASLARGVANGELDVALAVETGDRTPGVNSQVLAREDLLLACPPSHRFARRKQIRLQELVDEIFVETPVGWGIRTLADRLFAGVTVTREIALEVPDMATVVELVRAGLGVSLLTRSLVTRGDDLGLVPIKPTATFAVSILLPDSRPPSAAARALTDLATSQYRQMLE